MRRQIEWKVPVHTEEDTSGSGKTRSSLSLISFAALFVKVKARSAQGGQGSEMNSGRISSISSSDSSAAASSASVIERSADCGIVSE